MSNKNFYQKIKANLFCNFLIISAGLLFCQNIYSQGFDWQKGGRLPYEIPRHFIGINTSYSTSEESGDFNLKENLIVCCNFKNGSGKAFFAGITYEYWYEGSTAVNASAGLMVVSSDFKIRSTLPTKEGDFVTEYIFDSDIWYFDLILSLKRRILLSHFTLGAELRFSSLLKSTSIYTEQAISNNVPFEKRTLSEGAINELNSLLITPSIFASYDISLAEGYYISPYAAFSYNLNSIITDQPWHSARVSAGFKLFRNL